MSPPAPFPPPRLEMLLLDPICDYAIHPFLANKDDVDDDAHHGFTPSAILTNQGVVCIRDIHGQNDR